MQAAEAMSLCRQLEDPRGIAWSLDVFAGLMAARGSAGTAATLWYFRRVLRGVGASLVPTIAWIRERYFNPVRTELGEDVFERARNRLDAR